MYFLSSIKAAIRQSAHKYRLAHGHGSQTELLNILENEEKSMGRLRAALENLHTMHNPLITRDNRIDAEDSRKVVDEYLRRLRAAAVDIMRGKIPKPEDIECVT